MVQQVLLHGAQIRVGTRMVGHRVVHEADTDHLLELLGDLRVAADVRQTRMAKLARVVVHYPGVGDDGLQVPSATAQSMLHATRSGYRILLRRLLNQLPLQLSRQFDDAAALHVGARLPQETVNTFVHHLDAGILEDVFGSALNAFGLLGGESQTSTSSFGYSFRTRP